jgi:hypothetical protein
VVSAPSRLGPIARAALDLPVRGAKRRRILGLLAIAAERGHGPSIGELSRATGYPREDVVSAISGLERDGFLVVDRTDSGYPHNRRATYFLNLESEPKGPTMTTKTTTEPTEEAPAAPSPPSWQRAGFWPETTHVSWPDLADARAKHDAAAAALAEARANGEADAERTALLALADTLIEADRTLRESYGEAHSAFRDDLAQASRYGPGDTVPEGDWAAHRADLAAAREWADVDGAAFERVRGLIEQSVFVADFVRRPLESDHVAPAVSVTVARATVLKRELAA